MSHKSIREAGCRLIRTYHDRGSDTKSYLFIYLLHESIIVVLKQERTETAGGVLLSKTSSHIKPHKKSEAMLFIQTIENSP